MATNIKKYTKKDGSTAYMFKKYLGIDPITGKQKETTRRGFKTIKEAKLALSRLEVEVSENGFQKKKPNRSYSEVFEEWFDLVYKKKVKESTFWNTRIVFDTHILPSLGDLKINKITVPFCQKIANEWSNISPKRYQRFINYSGMVFKYAVSTGEIQDNVMSKIVMPAVTEDNSKEGDNFFDKEELSYFLTKLSQQKDYKRYAYFFLLSHTGLRKGESLALTWRDIDLKNKTLSVNKTLATGKSGKILVQTPKTKNSIRTISLDDNTISVLKAWRKIQSKELESLKYIASVDQLVFHKTDGNTYLNPSIPLAWLDTFYRSETKLKRINVHGLRHTHASLLFSAGISMKQAQARLGHSNITVTMNVYTHVTKDSKEETAQIFSNFMNLDTNLGQSLGQKKYPLD